MLSPEAFQLHLISSLKLNCMAKKCCSSDVFFLDIQFSILLCFYLYIMNTDLCVMEIIGIGASYKTLMYCPQIVCALIHLKKKGVPSAVGFPHRAGSWEGLSLSPKPYPHKCALIHLCQDFSCAHCVR